MRIDAILFFLFMTSLTYLLIPVFADSEINLIDEKYIWLPFSAAIVTQNASDLSVLVSTNYNGTLFNRAYLPIEIESDMNKSVFFDLEYQTVSYLGNKAFFSEIRDNETDGILWSSFLNGTDGQLTNETFSLPPTVLNIPLEFRFYIWTNGPGEHILDIKKAKIRPITTS